MSNKAYIPLIVALGAFLPLFLPHANAQQATSTFEQSVHDDLGRLSAQTVFSDNTPYALGEIFALENPAELHDVTFWIDSTSGGSCSDITAVLYDISGGLFSNRPNALSLQMDESTNTESIGTNQSTAKTFSFSQNWGLLPLHYYFVGVKCNTAPTDTFKIKGTNSDTLERGRAWRVNLNDPTIGNSNNRPDYCPDECGDSTQGIEEAYFIFNLGALTEDTFLAPGVAPNSTSTDLTITCDPDDGFFQSSLCNLLVYLFRPSSQSLNNFSSLKSLVQDKPPFGYFLSVKNAFDDLENGTTSMEVISTTTASHFSGIIDPIDTGISWVLYLMAGVWLINRMRHIEL